VIPTEPARRARYRGGITENKPPLRYASASTLRRNIDRISSSIYASLHVLPIYGYRRPTKDTPNLKRGHRARIPKNTDASRRAGARLRKRRDVDRGAVQDLQSVLRIDPDEPARIAPTATELKQLVRYGRADEAGANARQNDAAKSQRRTSLSAFGRSSHAQKQEDEATRGFETKHSRCNPATRSRDCCNGPKSRSRRDDVKAPNKPPPTSTQSQNRSTADRSVRCFSRDRRRNAWPTDQRHCLITGRNAIPMHVSSNCKLASL